MFLILRYLKEAQCKYYLQLAFVSQFHGHMFPCTSFWSLICGSVLFYVFPGVDGLSIDFTTMVDIRDQTNKELAMRLDTDIQSGDVFYTDLNGFQVSPPHWRQRITLHTVIISQHVSLITRMGISWWPSWNWMSWHFSQVNYAWPEPFTSFPAHKVWLIVSLCVRSLLLDAASPPLPKASPAGQLLSHAQPGVHPGQSSPPHAAHSAVPGCHQPGEWSVFYYIYN